MNIFYFIIQQTMVFMIPLMVVALGGLFSEKSGVVNIALEGKMVMGAFTGIFFIQAFTGRISPQLLLIIALLIAVATGIVVSLFHAFAAINLKANQVISGVAINMFGPAFAIYLSMQVLNTQNIQFSGAQFRIADVPRLGNIPVIGPMFFESVFITTYLGFIILAIAAFILYKTKFGLRLRACGDYPQAADSVGVSVTKMRYSGVIISGALAGLGGLIYIIPISSHFSGTVNGYGFLALAVLIFGVWKPGRILIAAFFFGLLQTIAASNSVIPFLANLNIPAHFYRMMPFIVTLIVLAFTSKNTNAPRAAGQPYDKGHR